MLRSRLLNILFWSVISAAFIGPGTVATAAQAGASFELKLLWALIFSIITCLTLQEASARLTIVSGYNLGMAIAHQYRNRAMRVPILILVIGAIIIGSAAYQTGNLLGAVGGLSLMVPVPSYVMVLVIGLLAAVFLMLPSLRFVARMLGFIVVFMGAAFLTTAVMIGPRMDAVLAGSFIPSFPEGSGLLVLALIGTTVVPYNLFLGSGIADRAQQVREMRFGLSVAVILGGIISMGVLIVGSAVDGPFSFESLAGALTDELGTWSLYLFGFGLFAAGFSSAVTAPLASAITARNLFAGHQDEKWAQGSRRFRLVWGFVLVVGVSFGAAGFRPIPAIITAQALNGLILPFVSIFLLFVVNDPRLMGRQQMNNWKGNALMGFIVWITLILGVINILKVINRIVNQAFLESTSMLVVVIVLSLIATLVILLFIYRLRGLKLSDEK